MTMDKRTNKVGGERCQRPLNATEVVIHPVPKSLSNTEKTFSSVVAALTLRDVYSFSKAINMYKSHAPISS